MKGYHGDKSSESRGLQPIHQLLRALRVPFSPSQTP
jgi:hypothetical protein